MNIFQTVKEAVSTREAASFYGINVRRNGMCICPFHRDKNPSMKVDSRYHCFACGEDGDVINFVAKMYGLSQYEAARKLANDFGVDVSASSFIGANTGSGSRLTPATTSASSHIAEAIAIVRRHALSILHEYRELLRVWKLDFAPTKDEWEQNDISPLYEESCKQFGYIDYIIDELTFGEYETQLDILSTHRREILDIEDRIKKYRTDKK